MQVELNEPTSNLQCSSFTNSIFLILNTCFDFRAFSNESAKSLVLRGNVGYVGAWVAWVNFLLRLLGLRGSKYFLRGS